MDSQTTKTYSRILAETLKKKQHILEQLEAYTKTQGAILNEEELDEEAFMGCIDEKQQLLLELEECDEGFEKLYPKVRKEYQDRGKDFRPEIENLQALIRSCTDLGVNIQTLEEKNRLKFEVKLNSSKVKLQGLRKNNMAAASYYKHMANQHQTGDSYFVDKKK